MSRPIPLEIIPSHAYLSLEDQQTLFGVGYPMTIAEEHSQPGQHVYKESIEVYGSLKRSLSVRVLGPNWDQSHVEVTPIEATFLGLQLEEVKSGDLSSAGACRLVGPEGEVKLKAGIIVPKPHLLCTPQDAEQFRIQNADHVRVEVAGEDDKLIEDVIVRVHPAFRLRLEVHQEYARDLWLTKQAHARIVN